MSEQDAWGVVGEYADAFDGFRLEVDKLKEENKRLRDAIKWVLTDMQYKAPEQFNEELVGTWYVHLLLALEN
jgi:hypothetical protein